MRDPCVSSVKLGLQRDDTENREQLWVEDGKFVWSCDGRIK